MSSIHDWSIIATNNANADSSINWAEGQPPSSVNNSARVMMARIKELLNDLGGVAVATGSVNGLGLAISSAVTAYSDGLRVTLRASNTNTGSSSLNVNSVGSRTIKKFTVDGETSLSGGEIRQNCIYEFIYCSILNSGSGAWIITNPTSVELIPAGIGAPLFAATVPKGWLLCNGSAVSRTTYAKLFAAIGTTWGTGNGTTTFNLPDGRDEFLRGASSTRALGTSQNDTIQSHTHTGTTSSGGAHTHEFDTSDGGGSDPDEPLRGNGLGGTSRGNTRSAGTHSHSFTTNATGGSETRPRNIGVHWIIKT